MKSASIASAGVVTLNSCKTTISKQTVDYSMLDEILAKPVLKKELFAVPVVIETLELLRFNDNFLCRVRSTDGAEGLSVGNNAQLQSVWPVFNVRLQPFFIGKDVRDLEKLYEELYVYDSNYKLQNLALWVPWATIEFAILDMLGRIANKSIGELIGEIPLECKTSSLESIDGVVTVPSGPGSGIEIDPGFIAKHEVLKG